MLQKELIAYTDDTAVPMKSKSLLELSTAMSNKLDIYSWLYKNNLMLNIDK